MSTEGFNKERGSEGLMPLSLSWSYDCFISLGIQASIDPDKLSGVRADDGFTITIQPSGATFDAKPHYACAHNILELTSGMTPRPCSIMMCLASPPEPEQVHPVLP